MARRLILALMLSLCFSSIAWADRQKEQSRELDEILRLVREGVSDELVIKHIEATDFVFDLSADDILELQDLGVSDAVIEALLDTAIQDQDDDSRSRRGYHDRDYDSSLYVSLSAGYFSPWYWYPYAWGFYYDPFPSCYSVYYYPFRYGRSWGWYGRCHNYYYRNWWPNYRYDNPSYYASATRRRQGDTVRVPRWSRQPSDFASRARRALPADAPRRRVIDRRPDVSADRGMPQRRARWRDNSGSQQPPSRRFEAPSGRFRHATPPAVLPPERRMETPSGRSRRATPPTMQPPERRMDSSSRFRRSTPSAMQPPERWNAPPPNASPPRWRNSQAPSMGAPRSTSGFGSFRTPSFRTAPRGAPAGAPARARSRN